MRCWIALVLAVVSVSAAWAGPSEDLEAAFRSAHSQKLFESATLLVGRHDEVLFERSLGPQTTLDSRFDLASLTKPFATALAAHALIDQGKLALDTKVSHVIPQFTGGHRDRVTVADLLSHQAGLPAGITLAQIGTPSNYEMALAKTKVSSVPGTKFLYSDAGFQLLGLVVEKATGDTLAEVVSRAIYAPLELSHTSYDPAEARPALNCGNCVARPHDPIARFMYPRSIGHAGLYSTAPELGEIVRMLLRGGMNRAGQTVLSARSVERLMKPYGVGVRSLGFDLTSPYATSPRGEIFPPGVSFGHTGYTGTSVWIDPTDGRFVILLTNRTYLSDSEESKKAIAALRKAAATLAAQL